MKKTLLLLLVLPAFAWAALTVVDDYPALPMAKLAVLAPEPGKQGVGASQIKPPEVWIVEPGMYLSEVLAAWARSKPKWHVEWDTKTDYEIRAPLRFEGTIDEAVAQVIRLYERAEKPLRVEISRQQQLIYVTNRN